MASLTFNPANDSSDGRDNYNKDTWPTDSVSSDATSIQCSFSKENDSPYYRNSRAFFYFDTSSIPDDATILSASLQIWCISKDSYSSNPGVYVVPMSGESTYTRTNLGFVAGGSISTGAYTTITLDITNLTIVKTGTTRLGLMEYYDFNNTAFPAVDADSYTISDTGDATNQPAILTVNYERGGSFIFNIL